MFSLWKQGVDYLPLLIERAHAQGLTFMASFRMNDTHIKSYPDSALCPEFWRTHQQYRLWDATDGKSYYNAALDYSFPEVRNRYRDAILEAAGWYDVDGIELDFTRSPYFFQPSEAWRKRGILTRFVKDLGDRLEALGEQRGKPYTLILRIASKDRALRTAGIDLRQWIQQRLAPIVILSELSINFNQTLEPWQSLCKEAGVGLYPAVEAGPAFHVTDFYTPYVRNDQAPRHDGSGGVKWELREELGMQRAAAQNLLAQKPDGLAMFNFPCRLAEGGNIMHTDTDRFRQVVSVLSEMGSLKTLARRPKHYAFYQDLPIYVETNRPRQYHQTIPLLIRGRDLREATVTLRWRQIAERNPHADGVFKQNPLVKPGWMRTFLNDREIPEAQLQIEKAPAGRIPSGWKLGPHQVVTLQVSGRELIDGTNTLAFEINREPAPRDPYIYIYDLTVDLEFAPKE